MMFLQALSSLLLVQGGDRIYSQGSSSLGATTKIIEVCLSPGCVADGADGALLKLQALAPSDVSVVPGVCCSLCGNGPVVMEESNKKHRRVSEKKIIEILTEDSNLDSNQEKILEGFNLAMEGDGALEKNDFTTAAERYAKAMEIGFDAAVSIVESQESTSSESPEDNAPQSLKWVISARRNEAKAMLGLKDAAGAISSAELAFELSCNTCTKSLEILQEACQMKGDEIGELNALIALFDLPEPQKQAPMEANKRRSLGFRLAKLKATVGS